MSITLFNEIVSAFSNRPDKVCFLTASGKPVTGIEFLKKIETIQKNLLTEFSNSFLYKKRVIVNIDNVENYLATLYALNSLSSTVVPLFSQDIEYIQKIYEKVNAIAYITDKNTMKLSSNYMTVPLRQLLEQSFGSLSISNRYNPEALIIYTSGTTGVPKGVILGNSGISHVTSFMNRYMQVDSSISEIVMAPLDHAFGFGRCHAVLKAGGSLFADSSRLNVRIMLDALEEKKINAVSIMPAQLTQIMKVVKSSLINVSNNLKWLQTGAMRFKTEDKNVLCEIFPKTTICMHFGMSESMRTTFINLNEEPDKRHTEGRASEGTQITIMDEEKNILPPNTEGYIAIRGKSLALGYVDHEFWEKSLYNGWFISNDRAFLDEEGYVHYCGRADDIINLNGLLIHPDEVENKLKPILSQYNFTVAGIPDPRGVRDRVIALFIEGEKDIHINTRYILKYLKDIDKHLVPSYIFWVDLFPRTKTGKVIRSKLYQLVQMQ